MYKYVSYFATSILNGYTLLNNNDNLPKPCHDRFRSGLRVALAKPSRELFAWNVGRLMEARGLSDAELARRVGEKLKRTISRATVGRWKKSEGGQEPDFEVRDALAWALGVPVSHLYRDATDKRTTAGVGVWEMYEMIGQFIPKPDDGNT